MLYSNGAAYLVLVIWSVTYRTPTLARHLSIQNQFIGSGANIERGICGILSSGSDEMARECLACTNPLPGNSSNKCS